MDILFIVPYVPSLIRARPYNFIRYLANRGHHLTLVTLWTERREKAELIKIKQYCKDVYAFNLPHWRTVLNCLVTLPTSKPLQASYCWQPELAKKIGDLAGNQDEKPLFDIIHIEHLRGVQYGLYLKAKGCYLPLVWDSVDCIYYLFRQAASYSRRLSSRLLTFFELNRTKKYEGWLLSQFDRSLVTSKRDKDEIVSLDRLNDTSQKVTIINNGVDIDYFTPNKSLDKDKATLVISGKMSYHANVSMVLYFVEKIMPLIWATNPYVRLYIVGKDPPMIIRKLGENPLITVTGTVSDIRPYLQKATIAIIPLTYGAGIQFKILEAMACATPVVASPKAVISLNVQPGKDLLVANEPNEYAVVINKLLNDINLRQQIGYAGREYVEKNHQWSNIAAQLEGVYNEVIHTKHEPYIRK